MEITLHTGCPGSNDLIHIDWFDENNVHQDTALEIVIRDQDKPRRLEIRLNGETVATIPPINPVCEDCGKPYSDFPLDVVLTDDQWSLITERSDGGGLLCAACIVERGSKWKYSAAKLVFE